MHGQYVAVKLFKESFTFVWKSWPLHRCTCCWLKYASNKRTLGQAENVSQRSCSCIFIIASFSAALFVFFCYYTRYSYVSFVLVKTLLFKCVKSEMHCRSGEQITHINCLPRMGWLREAWHTTGVQGLVLQCRQAWSTKHCHQRHSWMSTLTCWSQMFCA